MDNLITVNKLADLLARDRRTVGRRLAAVQVAEVRGRAKLYRLADALAALAERGDGLDLAQERARLAAVQADRGELELAVRRGELIPQAEIDAAWGWMLTNCRSRLLALPTRAAPLVVDGTPAEAEAILTTFIHEALAELSTDCLARAAECERNETETPREGRAGMTGATAAGSRRPVSTAAGRKNKAPRGRSGPTSSAAAAPAAERAARGAQHRPPRAGGGQRKGDQSAAAGTADGSPGDRTGRPDR